GGAGSTRWRRRSRAAAAAEHPRARTAPRVPVASPGAGPGSYRGVVSSGQMIDWDLAISTGVRWVRPGPQVSLAEARAVVSELHGLADAGAEPGRQGTGMSRAQD